MSITRTCAGWNRPFMTAFGLRLREDVSGMADPERLLVWVPSVRAGRHLLNDLLAGHESETTGVHPPMMVTPAGFLKSLVQDRPGVATDLQCLRAWKEVLASSRPADLRDLFPVIPSQQRVQWAWSMSRQLLQLRARLALEDHGMESITRTVSMERDRWRILSRLEREYHDWLAGNGLVDPNDHLRDNLGKLLSGLPYERMLVAGVLNLSVLEARILERLDGRGVPVELVLPVPEGHADQLDSWGRPLPEVWNTAAIPDSLLEGRVHRASDPRKLTGAVLGLARAYRKRVDALVVGSPDTGISDYLVERSRISPTPFYAPVGQVLATTGPGRLLAQVEQFIKSDRLAVLQELLHNVLLRDWAERSGMDPDSLERDLVAVQQDHFLFRHTSLSSPQLESIAAAGRIRTFVQKLNALFQTDWENPSFPEKTWNFLQHVALGGTSRTSTNAIIGQIEEILQEMQEQPNARTMKEEDGWELLRYCMETHTFYPERAAEQRPVSGWLELPWETAPHLVILGLSDAEVPGSSGSDTFLTPGLCKEAGLRTPEMESAYHACRLRMILEGRSAWGRVDILLPDRGLDDYPSQPSRFLFMAPEEELVNRVPMLLGHQEDLDDPMPAVFGCCLSPPASPPPESIAVTDFGAWLKNPFGYYVERRLRWRAPEAIPRELDALGFGNLAHAVMESFNRTETGRRLQSEKDIAAFLEQSLEETVAARLGVDISLPIRIQIDTLRQRLMAGVPDLASSRREGWIPLKVEWRINDEFPFEIGGLPVRGIVDLLEFNEDGNRYRIIDYKTSDKGDPPESTHLMNVSANTRPPLIPESDFVDGKKTRRWKDLQLPLYQMMVREAMGGEVTCAYFNLAKAVKDTGLREVCFNDTQLASARACAEGIVREIRSGNFPYIDPRLWDDPWSPWMGDSNAEVDPAWYARQEGAVQ